MTLSYFINMSGSAPKVTKKNMTVGQLYISIQAAQWFQCTSMQLATALSAINGQGKCMPINLDKLGEDLVAAIQETKASFSKFGLDHPSIGITSEQMTAVKLMPTHKTGIRVVYNTLTSSMDYYICECRIFVRG